MSDTEIRKRRIDTCRALIRHREMIGQILGFALCPCPTWDMLLDLYLAELEGYETYLWPLCMAAHVPCATAYRKIAILERDGLVTKVIDDRDHRRTALRVSDNLYRKINILLDQIQ